MNSQPTKETEFSPQVDLEIFKLLETLRHIGAKYIVGERNIRN